MKRRECIDQECGTCDGRVQHTEEKREKKELVASKLSKLGKLGS